MTDQQYNNSLQQYGMNSGMAPQYNNSLSLHPLPGRQPSQPPHLLPNSYNRYDLQAELPAAPAATLRQRDSYDVHQQQQGIPPTKHDVDYGLHSELTLNPHSNQLYEPSMRSPSASHGQQPMNFQSQQQPASFGLQSEVQQQQQLPTFRGDQLLSPPSYGLRSEVQQQRQLAEIGFHGPNRRGEGFGSVFKPIHIERS
jgi:hypothetical protein